LSFEGLHVKKIVSVIPVMLVGVEALSACGMLHTRNSTPSTVTAARSHDRDLEAIGDFNRLYLKAINDGDIGTLSALTEEDMVTIQPNWKAIEGKAANDRANRQSLQLFKIKEEWTPMETVIDGDLAYQRGVFTETSTPKNGGPSHVSKGNFLRIYRRKPDGTWRMTREMTSADQPVEMPRVRGQRASG
jgi:ketosteroid isomerase-like protein